VIANGTDERSNPVDYVADMVTISLYVIFFPFLFFSYISTLLAFFFFLFFFLLFSLSQLTVL
jgi:hypothetical protein